MKVFISILVVFHLVGCAPLIHEASLHMTCLAHKDDPLPYNHCEPTAEQLHNMQQEK